MRSHSYGNELYLHQNEISFSYQLRDGKRAACNHGVMDARGRLLITKEA